MRVGESSESRVQLVLSPLTSAHREEEREGGEKKETDKREINKKIELRGTPEMLVYRLAV